jgi:hypothetical protein
MFPQSREVSVSVIYRMFNPPLSNLVSR